MIFYQNYIGKLKKLVDRDQQVNGQLVAQNEEMDMFGQDQDVILEQIAEEWI